MRTIDQSPIPDQDTNADPVYPIELELSLLEQFGHPAVASLATMILASEVVGKSVEEAFKDEEATPPEGIITYN
jgi:hypothetical protein